MEIILGEALSYRTRRYISQLMLHDPRTSVACGAPSSSIAEDGNEVHKEGAETMRNRRRFLGRSRAWLAEEWLRDSGGRDGDVFDV